MGTYIGHGDNHHVLLVVKLARAQIEFEAKQIPDSIGHDQIPGEADGIGHELDHVGRYSHSGVPQREE
jgi:hypothetical protein